MTAPRAQVVASKRTALPGFGPETPGGQEGPAVAGESQREDVALGKRQGPEELAGGYVVEQRLGRATKRPTSHASG